MTRLFLLIFLSATIFQSPAQVKNVDILIGKTESQVQQYFDSLKNLKRNSFLDLKRDIAQSGDLMLIAKFSVIDESFYSCAAVITKFMRIDGNEICIDQTIIGTNEFAHLNLTYVKDTFKSSQPGIWEKPFLTSDLKIEAKFERATDESSTYSLSYSLVSADENNR